MRQGSGRHGVGSMRRYVVLGTVSHARAAATCVPLTGAVVRMMVATTVVAVVVGAGAVMIAAAHVVMTTKKKTNKQNQLILWMQAQITINKT